MENDKLLGLSMAIGGSLLIVLLLFIQILLPMFNEELLRQMPEAQYWGMAIPMFFFTSFGLGTIAWIGMTMYKNPAPEVGDFEDFEQAETDTSKEDKKAEISEKDKPKKEKKSTTKKPKTKAKKKETSKSVPKKEASKKDEIKSKEEIKAEEEKQPVKVEEESGYELTDIKGVGASSAENLKEAGFDTVDKIAQASISDLTKVNGVGKATATKYIDRAKELLAQ